jgi:hypothetical protein
MFGAHSHDVLYIRRPIARSGAGQPRRWPSLLRVAHRSQGHPGSQAAHRRIPTTLAAETSVHHSGLLAADEGAGHRPRNTTPGDLT